MAATGYRIAGTGQANAGSTNVVAGVYVGGLWLLGAQNALGSDDIFLYEKDSATPGTEGDEGGFTIAQTSGGDLELDHRGTMDPMMFQNPLDSNSFFCWGSHSSGNYAEYSVSGGTWTIDSEDETPGLAGAKTAAGVAHDGTSWIVELSGSSPSQSIVSRYRDIADDTWKDGGDLETSSGDVSAGDHNISPIWKATKSGVNILCCAYTWSESGTEQLNFAWRNDSDSKTATWNVVTIATNPTGGVDDHVSLVAAVLGSDTNSTIVVAMKTAGGTGGYPTYRSTDGGATWAAEGDVNTVLGTPTRVKLAIDETNGEVYAVAAHNNAIAYVNADATTTLSWGAAVDACRDASDTAPLTDVGVPSHPVDSDTDLLIYGTINDDVWWNIIDIAGGGGASGRIMSSLARGGGLAGSGGIAGTRGGLAG